MPTINRDRDIVRHILRYCEQVDTAHKDFGHSKERFEASTTYRNAISMCILQNKRSLLHWGPRSMRSRSCRFPLVIL